MEAIKAHKEKLLSGERSTVIIKSMMKAVGPDPNVEYLIPVPKHTIYSIQGSDITPASLSGLISCFDNANSSEVTMLGNKRQPSSPLRFDKPSTKACSNERSKFDIRKPWDLTPEETKDINIVNGEPCPFTVSVMQRKKYDSFISNTETYNDCLSKLKESVAIISDPIDPKDLVSRMVPSTDDSIPHKAHSPKIPMPKDPTTGHNKSPSDRSVVTDYRFCEEPKSLKEIVNDRLKEQIEEFYRDQVERFHNTYVPYVSPTNNRLSGSMIESPRYNKDNTYSCSRIFPIDGSSSPMNPERYRVKLNTHTGPIISEWEMSDEDNKSFININAISSDDDSEDSSEHPQGVTVFKVLHSETFTIGSKLADQSSSHYFGFTYKPPSSQRDEQILINILAAFHRYVFDKTSHTLRSLMIVLPTYNKAFIEAITLSHRGEPHAISQCSHGLEVFINFIITHFKLTTIFNRLHIVIDCKGTMMIQSFYEITPDLKLSLDRGNMMPQSIHYDYDRFVRLPPSINKKLSLFNSSDIVPVNQVVRRMYACLKKREDELRAQSPQ
jgi:hypothetical protein